MNDLIHAVAAFLLPPTGAFPLLLLAWGLRHRRRWLSGALFATGLIAVWVGSTEFGALWLQDRLLGTQQAVRASTGAQRPARHSPSPLRSCYDSCVGICIRMSSAPTPSSSG